MTTQFTRAAAARGVRLLLTKSASPVVRLSSTTAVRALSARTLSGYTKMFDADNSSVKTNNKIEKVPPEDYYDGHLMADHLEYLDDMMDKTVKLESNMEQLQETYEKKYHLLFSNVNWMESSEIEDLFHKSKSQNEQIQAQIAELKELMEDARKLIAVDSPDGTTDDMVQEDMKAVEEIIDYAQTHENKDAITALHAKEEQERAEVLKIMAVDGPDGTNDGILEVDKKAVEEIIDFARTHENKDAINALHAREEQERTEVLKIVAVDGPDGTVDEILEVDKKAVEEIIDYAQKHENKEAIDKLHAKQERDRLDAYKMMSDGSLV